MARAMRGRGSSVTRMALVTSIIDCHTQARAERGTGGKGRRVGDASLWADDLLAWALHRYIRSVYATCLFCSEALGRNESIENFPVGRRLAFDAAKGRLWVVCPSCARWNLTPLEVRWEAIEEAERAYRDMKLRTATENIGLATLNDGTELVRIGKPLLPEFAAWRYGDVFRRRWRRIAPYAAVGLALPLAYTGYNVAFLAGATF